MEIQLLGDLQVSHEGRLIALGGHRQRCVLAALLLYPGRVVPVERIVAHAWPADPPETAADLVTSYTSRLRRALADVSGHIRLVSRRPGYLAELDPDRIDAHRFVRLLRQAREEREASELEYAARHLREALELWRGTAFADLDSPGLQGERSRLEEARLDAMEELAELELAADRVGRIVVGLRETAQAHPHRERLTVLAVRALSAVGEPSQAAELASQAIRSLRRQGLDPSAALRQAHRDALRPDTVAQGTGISLGRAQLPADTLKFTGRNRELAELIAPVVDGRFVETVVTCTIDGMAGIGKTAFAVRAAHQLAQHFPDGQLFVDLHGFTPATEPTRPEAALDRLLRALGVAATQIPLEADERAALYRERLAATRTLIVLDNAASEAQVRPLLPGAPGCLVLITSRRRLTALDDAYSISLDVLSDGEATALFMAVAGPGRVPVGDPALVQTIELCGNMPLTLRIAAARLRNRPTWPLGYLAARLRDQSQRLGQLDDGERSLTATLNLSYDHLTAEEQKLFRHLGLHPGIDIDSYAAAALIDSSVPSADVLLDGLVNHNLLTEPSTGRYQLHDLIRLYAHDLAAKDTHAPGYKARNRLLDYYLHTARTASRLLSRQQIQDAPPVALWSAASPKLAKDAQAMAWMDAERVNLTALIDCCERNDLPSYVVALSEAMHGALHIQGYWALAQRLQDAALASALRLGDRQGQANALCFLGDTMAVTGKHPRAVENSTRALELYRELGDRLGQANAYSSLAQVHRLTARFNQAVKALESALDLYGDLDDWRGAATALTTLGSVQKLTGQYSEAEVNLDRAYRLCARFAYRHGQAAALADLGEVQQMTGQYAKAVTTLHQALDLYRYLGNRLGEASALTCLGDVRRLTNQYPEAERLLRRALDLYRQLGNRRGQAEALTILGAMQYSLRQEPQSLATLQQAYTVYRDLDDRLGQADVLTAMTDVQRAMGWHEEEASSRRRALDLYQEIEEDA